MSLNVRIGQSFLKALPGKNRRYLQKKRACQIENLRDPFFEKKMKKPIKKKSNNTFPKKTPSHRKTKHI